MSKLTKREIANKRKAAIDTLKLIERFPDAFFKALGSKGVEDLINQKLDELIFYDKEEQKNEKDENE